MKRSQFNRLFDYGEWRAPNELYDALDKAFDFTEGLNRFYCEPAKGKYAETLQAAYDAATKEGATVVCFLPAASDSEWWHKYVLLANEIIYIKGRVPLVDSTGRVGRSPVAPSVVVVFGPENVRYPTVRAMKKVQGSYFITRLNNAAGEKPTQD